MARGGERVRWLELNGEAAIARGTVVSLRTGRLLHTHTHALARTNTHTHARTHTHT